MAKAVKPKKKCCLSTPRCRRCPLQMLAAGTLPDGYTVRKRRLVKTGATKSKGKSKGKSKKGKKQKGAGRGRRPRGERRTTAGPVA